MTINCGYCRAKLFDDDNRTCHQCGAPVHTVIFSERHNTIVPKNNAGYEPLESLERVSFIAGTPYYLNYDLKDSSGENISLGGCKLTWRLSPQGRPEDICLLKVLYGDSNVFLGEQDTMALSGTYVQSMMIEDSTGGVRAIPSGIVEIVPSTVNT